MERAAIAEINDCSSAKQTYQSITVNDGSGLLTLSTVAPPPVSVAKRILRQADGQLAKQEL